MYYGLCGAWLFCSPSQPENNKKAYWALRELLCMPSTLRLIQLDGPQMAKVCLNTWKDWLELSQCFSPIPLAGKMQYWEWNDLEGCVWNCAKDKTGIYLISEQEGTIRVIYSNPLPMKALQVEYPWQVGVQSILKNLLCIHSMLPKAQPPVNY